jgi:hypothetical protein
VVAIAFQVVLFVYLRSANRDGRLLPGWLWRVSALFDLGVAAALLTIAAFLSPRGAVPALTAPPLLLIPVVILLSVLRLRPNFTLYTGLAGALIHLALAVRALAVTHTDPALRLLLDGDRTGEQIVAADGDERLDAEFFESGNRILESRWITRDIGARSAEYDAAGEMDPRDLLDRQFVLLIGVSLRQPFEAVMNADRRNAVLNRLDRHGGDHPIGARCRAATNQNAEFLQCHDSNFV